MKLKKAVIKTMSRDDLKAVVDSLEIDTVDRRGRNSMAKKRAESPTSYTARLHPVRNSSGATGRGV